MVVVLVLLFSHFVWSVQAADESIVISPQNVTNKAIKVSSPRDVFEITAKNTSIHSLMVLVNPITTFSTQDLVDLTNDASSGVGLYTSSGVFQPLNSVPTWDGNAVTFNFNPPLPAGNYNLVLKFKPSVVNGASFSVTINDGAVVSDPSALYTAASTAPYILDNAASTAPSDIKAWDSAAKTIALDPFKYYGFPQPYFELSGAADTSNINGYFVYFGSDQNADPVSGGVRIPHQSVTPFSGAPLPNEIAQDYYLRVATIDNSGVIAAPTTMYVYRYDKKKPIKASGAPLVQTPLDDTTPTWTWESAFDPDSGIARYQFFWVKEASGMDPFFAEATTDPLVPSFTHNAALDGGKWVAGVRAVDAAGNFIDSQLGSIIINAPVLVPTVAPTTVPVAPNSGNSSGGSAPAASAPSISSDAPAVVVANGKTGDFNNDGKVDLKDFNVFVFNWKKANVPQDLNKDGTVDLKDFNTFVFNWNK